jgi:hypothetical protein
MVVVVVSVAVTVWLPGVKKNQLKVTEPLTIGAGLAPVYTIPCGSVEVKLMESVMPPTG